MTIRSYLDVTRVITASAYVDESAVLIADMAIAQDSPSGPYVSFAGTSTAYAPVHVQTSRSDALSTSPIDMQRYPQAMRRRSAAR